MLKNIILIHNVIWLFPSVKRPEVQHSRQSRISWEKTAKLALGSHLQVLTLIRWDCQFADSDQRSTQGQETDHSGH